MSKQYDDEELSDGEQLFCPLCLSVLDAQRATPSEGEATSALTRLRDAMSSTPYGGLACDSGSGHEPPSHRGASTGSRAAGSRPLWRFKTVR